MGMSRNDFCRCTPSEFKATWDAWNDMRQNRERGEWERLRMQCLCTLQPYTRKTLAPADIMTFPWEKPSPAEKRGKEEVMRRYREAKAAAGLE